MQKKTDRLFILKVACFSEGLLLLLGGVWMRAAGLSVACTVSGSALFLALFAALALILVNLGLFSLARKASPASQFVAFKKEVIEPLCAALTPRDAFLVAALSGAAEEFFFRAILQQQGVQWFGAVPGILAASIIFAYIHFIGALRKYFLVFCAYILFSLYFAALFHYTDNLLVPAVVHFLNNFVIILAVRSHIRLHTPGTV